MSHLPTLCIGFSAALFCALSATMNALFLSSLGRTGLEAALFAALSLAGDFTKAALPIVVLRSIQLRAWGHVGAAAVMLSIVTVLSVSSGAGFAATTRSMVVASRQADVDGREALQKQLRDLENRRAQMPMGPSVRALDAELTRLAVDRRWALSKECREVAGTTQRQFCDGVLRLKADRVVALDRAEIEIEQRTLDARLAALSVAIVDADPQASAVADLVQMEAVRLRRYLSIALALVIELGSIILVVLWSGPALLHWRDPAAKPAPSLAEMPVSLDVVAWQRRRDANRFAFNQE